MKKYSETIENFFDVPQENSAQTNYIMLLQVSEIIEVKMQNPAYFGEFGGRVSSEISLNCGKSRNYC